MEARIKLILDGKEFSAKMQIAENELQQLKRNAEGMRESVAGWGMAVTGFQSALMLISQQLIPILSKPLMEAGQIEQYRTSLKVMMGDADLAEERLQELVTFAAETPFELPQVIEAGNKLQALGRYSKETLTALGDLASASGKPMEQALSAYAKMASGQKGIAVDMFRDLLITQEDWANATGKGFKKSGESLATYSEMLEALPKIIKDKGFAGMMEEQSKTLVGKLSNLKDVTGQTFAEIGQQMLPLVKDILDNVIPAMQSFKDNLGTVAPVIGGLTLSVVLYTTAMKAQAIAEAISTASINNNAIAMAAKNIALGLTQSVQTLTTASTLAYGIAHDVLTGKITKTVAVSELLKLTAMSTAAVLTLLGAGIGVITLAWGAYEMTVGRSRKEMVELTKETERSKYGLEGLDSKLKTMSFEEIAKQTKYAKERLKDYTDQVDQLSEATLLYTKIRWLDSILSQGKSDILYDVIDELKARGEIQKELIDKMDKYVISAQQAIEYTKSFYQDIRDFKPDKLDPLSLTLNKPAGTINLYDPMTDLKNINQVDEAITKVTIAQGLFTDEYNQKETAKLLERLNKRKAEIQKASDDEHNDKKKTYEQMVKDKISFYEELKKLDRSTLPDFKAYLEEQYKYYSETLLKRKSELKNFTKEELQAFSEVKDKLKEIRDLEAAHVSFELPEGLKKGEREQKRKEQQQALQDEETLAKLRIDAIRDSLKRQEAEIEKWYAENKETDLYLKNEEAKSLIDIQYANKRRDLREQEIEQERQKYSAFEGIAKDSLMEIGDLHKSGSEKWEAILQNFYNKALDLLTNYVVDYLMKMALTNPDKTGGLVETAERVGEIAVVTAANVVASNIAIAETTAAVVASMEAITLSASTAATLVSIASFGGAALAGSAGVIAALALIKGLTAPGGLVGFAQGGAIVGEKGPELIAPIQTYIDVNRNLVTGTVMAVERSLQDVRLQSNSSNINLSKLESLMSNHIAEISKWKREINFKVRGNDLKTAVDRINSYYDKFEAT